ncbi:hypothetical protein FDH29_gp13 [Aquamicrobium phage P14]|uniref:Uncharacterized protein n=1 Tax=Aquamicrobium phage P14 TaxID=1927013 RepID=A0A1L5C064_9CAUD|nr:hypothetical protein FDH29_gp13 [Aquamicrobium phage P14]APL99471.1 hypothetical protein BB738_0130 [Aquamicrobium phage P14]
MFKNGVFNQAALKLLQEDSECTLFLCHMVPGFSYKWDNTTLFKAGTIEGLMYGRYGHFQDANLARAYLLEHMGPPDFYSQRGFEETLLTLLDEFEEGA